MTAEETSPQGSESPSTPPNSATGNPTGDFREYVQWRKSGDPPPETAEKQPEEPASAPDAPPAAETAPEPGPEESQETEEEEDQAKGKEGAPAHNSRQRKIQKLAKENEELRAQLAAATQPKPSEPKKPEEPPGKPKLENFESLEQYQEALTDWRIDQRDAKRRAEEQQREQQKATEKLSGEWASRQQAARKAHPDYDDAIEAIAAPDGPGVFAARQAMLEDEAGAEILYWLAKHPDELKRIAALQPIAAVREVGRLSATLTRSSEPANGKRITAAPKPPPGATRPAKASSDSIFDPAVAADFKRWVRARAQMKDR